MQRVVRIASVTAFTAILLLALLAESGASVAKETSPYVVPNLGVIATIPIPSDSSNPGQFAWGPVYNPFNGDLYVEASQFAMSAFTLYIISGASNAIVATVGLGVGPAPPMVDPASGEVYVSETGSALSPGSTVTAVSGQSGALLRNISVGVDPGLPVLDPANGNLYIPCDGETSVVATSNDTLVATVPGVSIGAEIVYSNLSGDLYISGAGSSGYSNNLTVFSPADGAIVGVISLGPAVVGSDIQSMLYDDSNGDLYVYQNENRLDVVSTGTDQVVNSLTGIGAPVLIGPGGVVEALEPGNVSVNVSAISPDTSEVVARFSIPLANGFAYSPSTGDLYETSGAGNGTVTEVSASSGVTIRTLSVGTSSIIDPVYDPGNGDLYVEKWGQPNPSILVIGPTTTVNSGTSNATSFLEGLGVGVGIGCVALVCGLLLVRRRHRGPAPV